MKAKELMIGDWVWDKENDCPCQINIKDFRNNGNNILFFEPIPLTAEILEKNGFIEEEREGDPTFPYSAFILEEQDYRIEICWFDAHDKYEANTGQYMYGVPEMWVLELAFADGTVSISQPKLFVHHIQHALSFCGIKKEISI